MYLRLFSIICDSILFLSFAKKVFRDVVHVKDSCHISLFIKNNLIESFIPKFNGFVLFTCVEKTFIPKSFSLSHLSLSTKFAIICVHNSFHQLAFSATPDERVKQIKTKIQFLFHVEQLRVAEETLVITKNVYQSIQFITIVFLVHVIFSIINGDHLSICSLSPCIRCLLLSIDLRSRNFVSIVEQFEKKVNGEFPARVSPRIVQHFH